MSITATEAAPVNQQEQVSTKSRLMDRLIGLRPLPRP